MQKETRTYIKLTPEENRKVATLMLRRMLNDESNILDYFNKVQDSLPKERRHQIRAKAQLPKGVLALYDELVKQMKELLADKNEEVLKPAGPMLEDASQAEIAAEVGKRLGVPQAVTVGEMPLPPSMVLPGAPLAHLRIDLVAEASEQEKKPRVLLVGVWPKHEKRFACFSSRVELDFRAGELKLASQAPKSCDFCIAVTSHLGHAWKQQIKHYPKLQRVANMNAAVAAVQTFIDEKK